MNSIIKILGNRVAVRRRLPPLSTLVLPESIEQPTWEAEVVLLGEVQEPVKAGDLVMVERCGSALVVNNGEKLELISVLSIILIYDSPR